MTASQPAAGANASRLGLDGSLGSSFPPLPPGRHNLPQDFVRSYQRQRIIAAMIETVARCGPVALPVAQVVKTAGISRRTFYEHFSDCDECFDVACEEAFEYLFEPFRTAYAAPGPWAERLSAALTALLVALEAERRLAELCLVHSPARQRRCQTYRRAVETLVDALHGAREERASGRDPSPLGEELLAGGVVALIAARLAGGRSEGLAELAPQLAHLLTAPLELDGTDWPIAPAALT